MKCAVSSVWSAVGPAGSVRGRLGLGSYSGDEVLLMRRPTGPETSPVPFIAPGAGNQVLFVLDDAAPAQFRPEATPPFRSRNLLGAWQVGPIRRKDFAERLLFHVPSFLARDVRADAAPDLLYLLFLSTLHDMGRLEARTQPATALLDALRATLQLYPKLVEPEPGEALPPLAACVTNGQHIVAGAVGTDLWVLEKNGIEACRLCSEPDRTPSHDPQFASHPDVRVVAFAHVDGNEAPAGFRAVPAGQVVAVTDLGELLSRAI